MADLEISGWVKFVGELLSPVAVALFATAWRERASGASLKTVVLGLRKEVDLNTSLMGSHSRSITQLESITALMQSDKTRDSQKLDMIDGKLNRLLGERDGERAAEDRQRRGHG